MPHSRQSKEGRQANKKKVTPERLIMVEERKRKKKEKIKKNQINKKECVNMYIL